MVQNVMSTAEPHSPPPGQMMLDRVDATSKLLGLVRQFAAALPETDSAARDAALPDAGLTSLAAVKLMLAIEAEYNLSIPDVELTPGNFATVRAIEAMISRLRAG
jgi:acyl carrier protein